MHAPLTSAYRSGVMERWEHFVRKVSLASEADQAALELWLNQLGADGWMLVSCLTGDAETVTIPKGGMQSVSGGSTTGARQVRSVVVFLRRLAR